jgi:hypothetical protein
LLFPDLIELPRQLDPLWLRESGRTIHLLRQVLFACRMLSEGQQCLPDGTQVQWRPAGHPAGTTYLFGTVEAILDESGVPIADGEMAALARHADDFHEVGATTGAHFWCSIFAHLPDEPAYPVTPAPVPAEGPSLDEF